MAEEEGKPKADIPDLKKAAAERFAWSADPLLPRAAAPGPAVKASAGAAVTALITKLKATVVGRIALLTVLAGVGFGLGVGVLALAVLEVGPAKPTGRKGLGAVFSRLHVRPEYGDRLRYVASKGEVFFSPLRGAKSAEGPDVPPEPQTAEAAAAAADAAAQVAEGAAAQLGDVDVKVNTAGGTRAGVSGGSASALAGGAGGPGAKGSAGRDAGAAKFNESNGKLNAKTVNKGRVTRAALATSGGRNAGGATNLGDYRRTRTPIAGPARGPDGQTPGENRKSGLDFVLGGGGGAAGGPSAGGAAPAGAVGAQAGGGAGGGGGSGDSGAGPGEEDVDSTLTGTTLDQINTLMQKSSKESDKQADEIKKAVAFAAAGLHPAAAYHYMQADKAKKKSKQYSDQAQSLTQELSTQYKSGAAGEKAK